MRVFIGKVVLVVLCFCIIVEFFWVSFRISINNNSDEIKYMFDLNSFFLKNLKFGYIYCFIYFFNIFVR